VTYLDFISAKTLAVYVLKSNALLSWIALGEGSVTSLVVRISIKASKVVSTNSILSANTICLRFQRKITLKYDHRYLLIRNKKSHPDRFNYNTNRQTDRQINKVK